MSTRGHGDSLPLTQNDSLAPDVSEAFRFPFALLRAGRLSPTLESLPDDQLFPWFLPPNRRFGRMFPSLPRFRPPDEGLRELGTAMEDVDFFDPAAGRTDPDDPTGDNNLVPAGFTYFGQFVDHDMTFDKTSSFPPASIEPEQVTQARTPVLDLDSLYGAGPFLQPELYESPGLLGPAKFRIGTTSDSAVPDENGTLLPVSLPHDLPRHAPNAENKAVAIIGDPRNDENLVVAQLHLAFLQFHNKIIDDMQAGTRPPYMAAALRSINSVPFERQPFLRIPPFVPPFRRPTAFDRASRLVRWHYQWIVLHDFLPRVIRADVLDSVVQAVRGGRTFFQNAGDRRPFMPVEFSVAAYRLGHSMIRESYNYNRVFRFGGLAPATLDLLFKFTGDSAGDAPIPSNWIVDWRRFFEIDNTVTPNPSRKLDTRLANPLKNLQQFHKVTDDPVALAARNLLRGSRLGLPSGQAVAQHLGVTDVLTEGELSSGATGTVASKHNFHRETPLWFYILKEAEVKEDGQRLGILGSRIVAEVFVGLLKGDSRSFFSAKPDWQPTLPSARAGHFTLADMLSYVGNVNPLG